MHKVQKVLYLNGKMCTGSMNASSFKYEKKTLPCFTCRDEDTYLRALPSDKPEGQ